MQLYLRGNEVFEVCMKAIEMRGVDAVGGCKKSDCNLNPSGEVQQVKVQCTAARGSS